MKNSILLTLLAGLLATPAFAGTWTVDASHSKAEFKVKHLMVSTVNGRFSDVKGTMEYTPGKIQDAKVTIEVATASVDTDEPKRDEHLRSADFFDVATYPTMKFISKKITDKKITGDLTIRGVTKEVSFDIIDGPTGIIKHPFTGKDVFGASARTTINRQDFGVSWNKKLDAGGVIVSDNVEITINLEMTAQ